MYIYVNVGRCNCWMFPPNSTLKCLKQNSAFLQRRLKRTYGPVWASSLPVTKRLKANNKLKNISSMLIHRKWQKMQLFIFFVTWQKTIMKNCIPGKNYSKARMKTKLKHLKASQCVDFQTRKKNARRQKTIQKTSLKDYK